MIITDVLPVCQEYGDIVVKMYLAIRSSVSSQHLKKNHSIPDPASEILWPKASISAFYLFFRVKTNRL